MNGKIVILMILIIMLGVITLGLIGWQTGFVVKDFDEDKKGGLKLVELEEQNFPLTDEENIIEPESSSSDGGGSRRRSSSDGNDNSDDSENKTKTYSAVISTSSYSGKKDNEFTINVEIDVDEKIYAAEFELEYDENVLGVMEVEKGDFLSKDEVETYEVTKEEEGKIIFASTRLGQVGGVSGKGILAKIKFKALNVGSSELTLSKVKIADVSLEVDKFQVDIKNSEVTIS